jgi:hypothetical protein
MTSCFDLYHFTCTNTDTAQHSTHTYTYTYTYTYADAKKAQIYARALTPLRRVLQFSSVILRQAGMRG